MTIKDIASLLFRLVGILVIAITFPMIGNIVGFLSWNQEQVAEQGINARLILLAAVIPWASLTILGLALVFAGPRFARLFSWDGTERRTQLAAADLHSVLLSCTGLLILGISAPDIPAAVWRVSWAFAETDIAGGSFKTEQQLSAVGTVLQMVVGLALFVGSTSFVALIRRRFGRAKVLSADGACSHCGYWLDFEDYNRNAELYRCSNCLSELPQDFVAEIKRQDLRDQEDEAAD